VPIPDVSKQSIAELISLSGRAAVVTGAARGIGRSVAHRLAEAGAGVVVADIDGEAAEFTAREVAATGGSAIAVAADVTSADSMMGLAERCVAEFGRLDVWVSNAGIFPASPFLDIDPEEWDRVLRVNLDGAFYGARAAAGQMVAGGRGGVIVNMTSTSALRGGPPGMSHYSASKHGVAGLTKSLAIELGPHGIRVLAVAPTRVLTKGVEEYHRSRGNATDPEVIAAARIGGPTGMLPEEVPLGRTAFPDDVARVVLFCASDLSMLLTGTIIPVDAGILAS